MSPLTAHPPFRLHAQAAAWALSVVAHATALGLLAWVATQRDMPASLGQRVGALQVRIKSTTPRSAHLVPNQQAPAPSPQPTQPVAPPAVMHTSKSKLTALGPKPVPLPPAEPPSAPPPQVQPEPAPQPVAKAPSGPAITAAPATAPPTPPGASFANLFAPIISRPMGRGRWGAAPPQVSPQPDPNLLRQQAVQGRRDQLMQQVQWLQGNLNQTPLTGVCQVQITLSQNHGALTCDKAADETQVRAALSAFLLPGEAGGNIPNEVCLRVHGHEIEWLPCETTAPNEKAAP